MPKPPPPVYPVALPCPEGDRSTAQVHIDWTIHEYDVHGWTGTGAFVQPRRPMLRNAHESSFYKSWAPVPS
jgi:hypothetical protein